MNSIPTTKRSTILGLMTHVIVLTIVFILPEVIFTPPWDNGLNSGRAVSTSTSTR